MKQGPHFLALKIQKIGSAPHLSFSGCVRRSIVLLEREVFISKVFLLCLRCWDQNILNIHICIQFRALFDKNEGDFHILETATQTMTKAGFCRR